MLQVFEEVSNSHKANRTQETNNFGSNLGQQPQPHFNTLLPPLIRNPQQNHMPGLHQVINASAGSQNTNNILPTLIRNPHQQSNLTLPQRDSGALQVVQSFLDQSQTSYETNQQQQQQQQQDLQNHYREQTQNSSLPNPGYAKEYINFVGSRDEAVQKSKLLSLTLELQQQHQQQQERQQEKQQELQRHQEIERLNSAKRKCQERNDKLAEDLKRKMMEFSMLKHNVQTKLLEKQLQGQVTQIQNSNIKKRGRPKKSLTPTVPNTNSNNREVDSPTEMLDNRGSRSKSNSRQTKRKLANSPTTNAIPTPTDHAYFRQRSAAREAVKRINATVNNNQ